MAHRGVRVGSFTVAVVWTVIVVAGAAGCGGGAGDELPEATPPSPQVQPTPSAPAVELSAAEREAVDEAKAAFDRFMNAYIEVSTADLPTAETAEQVFAQVDEHAAGLLPQELRAEIVRFLWSEQQVVDGTLLWTFVQVLDVDLDRRVEGRSSPQVDLRYCVDATDWVQVDAGTGDAVGSPGARHLWSVAVVWWDFWGGIEQGPGQWRVVEREKQEGQPC